MLANKLKALATSNGTLIGVILLLVVFSITTDNFLTLDNISNIAESSSALGVVAILMALLVVSGAVDLSVGSVASLAGILSGLVMVETGSISLGIFIGLIVGIVAGVINGILVSYLQFNSIVVTLGSMSVWGGLALFATGGRTVSGFPEQFIEFGFASVLGVPVDVVILIAAILYGFVVLERKPYGRRLKMIGGSSRSAFLMGISVKKVQFFMFVQVGVAASIAGMMLSTKLGAATPVSGQGLEIGALTVVLLGGVAFTGGVGSVLGVVSGIFFVAILRNGLVVNDISQFLQQVFIGITLIAAVALDDTLRQRMLVRVKQASSGEQ